MNAYVRLEEVDKGPVYLLIPTIDAISTYGDGSQIYIGSYDSPRYTVEECPDAVFKLIQEAEISTVLRIDEVEEERSARQKEAANAEHN